MMSHKDVIRRSLLVHGFSQRWQKKCPNYHFGIESYHTQLCYSNSRGPQAWRDIMGDDTQALLSQAPMQYKKIIKVAAFNFKLGVKQHSLRISLLWWLGSDSNFLTLSALSMSLLDSIGKLSWTVNNISLYHVFVLWYSLKAFTGNRCLGRIFWLYSYSWSCLQDLVPLTSG